MSNPWTKKNPMLSIWLSAANSVAGSARARTTAAAKRQGATAQAQAVRGMLEFWGVGTGKAKAKRRSRR